MSYHIVQDGNKWLERFVTELWSSDSGLPQHQTDLEFRCFDGHVSAHQVYLTEYCRIFTQLCYGVKSMLDPKLTIILPDFKVQTVKSFLHLIYTGSVYVENKAELDSIKEFAVKHLGFSKHINWGDQIEGATSEDDDEDEEDDISECAEISDSEMDESTSDNKASADKKFAMKHESEASGDQNPNFLRLKNPSDLTHTQTALMKRERDPMGTEEDDERGPGFIEPDCVVDENIRGSGQPQTWKYNFISEDKYTIKKDTRPYGFRYTLDAPTSVMVKITEDRMTYINMNKFYDIALEYKPGPGAAEKIPGPVRSVVMLVFRGRHTEEEELKAWQYWHSKQTSSGFCFENKKIIEADLGSAYGILGKVEQVALNALEFVWNPSKCPARLAIAVQCLSTDFSDQKGVKGQPLHIQIDTYNDLKDTTVSHRGYSQIKIFRDKGAQRKHRDEIKQAEKWNSRVVKVRPNTLQPPCERTEFHNMADLEKMPFLFKPVSRNDNGASSPKVSKAFSLSGILPIPITDHVELTSEVVAHAEEPPSKRPRLSERVMIYTKRPNETTYSPLHVIPPTIDGLITAIKTKFEIDDTCEIQNVIRKSKNGAIVKYDDDMVKFYSHESMFIVQLNVCKGLAGKRYTIYDVTFCEA